MVLERFSLSGRSALVTGGSRGIGRAIALALAEAGADVAIVSRGGEDLDRTAQEIDELDVRGIAITGDVGRPEDRERIAEEVAEALSGPDILVNNAAAKPTLRPLMECPEEVWDELIEVNVKAYFELTRAVVPRMRDRGWGRIINVSSTTGLKARAGMGEYAVSKAAEIMLSRSFAVELGSAGITVNALVPVLTKTEFSQRQWEDPEEVERVVSNQAIPRIGQPDDVAGAALLLASDAGSFITGSTVLVDGGLLA